MGEQGDFRDALKELAAMRPLTEREKRIACLFATGLYEIDDDPNFFGAEAADVAQELLEFNDP